MLIDKPHKFFSRDKLSDALNERKERMVNEIARASRDEVSPSHADAYVDGIVECSRVKRIEILKDDIYRDERIEDVPVDVSKDPDFVLVPGDSTMRQGTRFTFYVPYVGDRWLFDCQPSSGLGMVRPQGTVEPRAITFHYDVVRPNAEWLRHLLNTDVGHLESLVYAINKDVANFNDELYSAAKAAAKQRQRQLDNVQDTLDNLDFPTKPPFE